jgi:hypothetical protein
MPPIEHPPAEQHQTEESREGEAGSGEQEALERPDRGIKAPPGWSGVTLSTSLDLMLALRLSEDSQSSKDPVARVQNIVMHAKTAPDSSPLATAAEFDRFAKDVRIRIGAENRPEQRQVYRNMLKVGEWRSADVKVVAGKAGHTELQLAVGASLRPARTDDPFKKSHSVYIEDGTSLASYDFGPTLVSAVTRSIHTGGARIQRLQNSDIASFQPDQIELTVGAEKIIYRRATPDRFDEKDPASGNPCRADAPVRGTVDNRCTVYFVGAVPRSSGRP